MAERNLISLGINPFLDDNGVILLTERLNPIPKDILRVNAIAGMLWLVVGTIDYISDVIVLIDWFLKEHYIWSSFMITCIVLSGTVSLLIAHEETVKWYMVFYVCGITQFEIFNLLNPTDESIESFGAIRIFSTVLESFPSGALQLYVLILEKNYQNINFNLLSATISGLSAGYGIQSFSQKEKPT
eukprot:UN32356